MIHKYFPCSLNIEGRRVLVIGAGREADEKTERLKKAGARVKNISFDKFKLSQLSPYFMVFLSLTDDLKLTKAVWKACRKNKILLCAIDRADYCDVTNVSVFERGHLKIMISTDGVSPALARKIRLGLEAS